MEATPSGTLAMGVLRYPTMQAPSPMECSSIISAIGSVRQFFVDLASGFTRFGLAVRGVALWLYHAPGAPLQLLRHVFHKIVSLVIWTRKILLIGTAGTLALVFALAILRLVCGAYMARLRELEALELARKLMRDRLREDILSVQRQQAGEREREQRQEAERRRAEAENPNQERARKAAEYERAQREHQRQHFEGALRAQQRLEDKKLYFRWRASCDAVFESGQGSLPPPPFWPCDNLSCKQDRHFRACIHNLGRLFSATDNLQQTLKEERRRWHPDGMFFLREGRQDAKSMANEIFKMMGNLGEPR